MTCCRAHLAVGRGAKVAYIDDTGPTTFAELDDRCRRFAGALRQAGYRREERVLLCALDTIDFLTVFLGCLLAGVVPVAVNTLLTVDDYAYMLDHSGARAVVVPAPLLGTLQAAIDKAGTHFDADRCCTLCGGRRAADRGRDVGRGAATGPSHRHRPGRHGLRLYSSGSTGRPKGTVHTHGNLFHTADLYARQVLGLREDDVVFSAAVLFFALRAGQCADVSAVRRRHDGADGRAAHAAGGVPAV